MRPTSEAETLQTLKSAKSRQSRSKPRGHAQTPSDTLSIMTLDPNDDSDYDMEERRLMPLFMKKVGTCKPNSRKALKFLSAWLNPAEVSSSGIVVVGGFTCSFLLCASKRDQWVQRLTTEPRRPLTRFRLPFRSSLFHPLIRINVWDGCTLDGLVDESGPQGTGLGQIPMGKRTYSGRLGDLGAHTVSMGVSLGTLVKAT